MISLERIYLKPAPIVRDGKAGFTVHAKKPEADAIEYVRADLVTDNDVVDDLQARNEQLQREVWALVKERDELGERLGRS